MEAKNKLQLLNSLRPIDFMDNPEIRQSLINTYSKTHPDVSAEEATAFVELESNYFKRILLSSKEAQDCTLFSLFNCLMDVCTNDLSFDPSADLMYLEVTNVNTGSRDQPKWEKRAINRVSPYGELAKRIKSGQLKYVDQPVVVYEGDTFKLGAQQNGNKYVIWEAAIPRKSKNIVGSFMKLVRPDGSFDYGYLLEDDIEELKKRSAKRFKGKANDLYGGDSGQIDAGFLKAKTIRHSFKGLPKVKGLGNFTRTEEEEEMQQSVHVVEKDGTINPALNGHVQHNDFEEKDIAPPQFMGKPANTTSFDHDEF